MPSAPPLTSHGNSLWNWTLKTPSSAFRRCAVYSCTHDLEVLEMSHNLIEPSWPPDTKVKPLGSISSAVTPSKWADIVNTEFPVIQLGQPICYIVKTMLLCPNQYYTCVNVIKLDQLIFVPCNKQRQCGVRNYFVYLCEARVVFFAKD
jgi:hypothetical protein